MTSLQTEVSAVLGSEEVLDTVVRVERTVPCVYPSWTRRVLHPELETLGPAVYDLVRNVRSWLHFDQKDYDWMSGLRLYKYFGARDLGRHLGLHDALEIQKKGSVLFRRVFGKMTGLYFWRSCVQSVDGQVYVPRLSAWDSDVVGLHWFPLKEDWGHDAPAARFRDL